MELCKIKLWRKFAPFAMCTSAFCTIAQHANEAQTDGAKYDNFSMRTGRSHSMRRNSKIFFRFYFFRFIAICCLLSLTLTRTTKDCVCVWVCVRANQVVPVCTMKSDIHECDSIACGVLTNCVLI